MRAADRQTAMFGVSAASPSDATPSIQALIIFTLEQPMDGMVLAIFLLASFLGGLTSGLAGFA
ncbi:MAG: hypothetical protein WBG10_00610, partial [Pseudolabrys sp.]